MVHEAVPAEWPGEGPPGLPGATATPRQEAAAAQTRGAAWRFDLENMLKAGVTARSTESPVFNIPPESSVFWKDWLPEENGSQGGFWSSPGATLAAPPHWPGFTVMETSCCRGHPSPQQGL